MINKNTQGSWTPNRQPKNIKQQFIYTWNNMYHILMHDEKEIKFSKFDILGLNSLLSFQESDERIDTTFMVSTLSCEVTSGFYAIC